MKAIEATYRLYNCARCAEQVRICRGCDRGNRYCAGACARIRRRESLRRAGARYQQSYRGAHRHAARQSAWRRRQQKKVTHQGSAAGEVAGTVALVLTEDGLRSSSAANDDDEPPEPEAPPRWRLGTRRHPSAARCSLCGRVLGRFARFDPVRGGA